MNVLCLLTIVTPILTALTSMDISYVLVIVDFCETKLYVKVSSAATVCVWAGGGGGGA